MNQEEVWDRIAPVWNKVRPRADEYSVEFLKNKTGKILDLGCGSGRNFLAFSKDSEIYGVDFSKEMLKFARENSERLGINFKGIYSDSDKVPLEGNFFDFGICVAVLHCIEGVEKRRLAVEEFYRVLKPGAEAYLSVWSRNSPRLKNKDKETFVPWTSAGVKKRYTYIYDFEELKGELERVGFEVLDSWEDLNICFVVRK